MENPNDDQDQLVISKVWLRECHETAIHEFNAASSDKPTFRAGYWNGYAMAFAAILKYFPDETKQAAH